jgi:alanyl-tRNA synthetase/REP element-mobilizing transposase RayT
MMTSSQIRQSFLDFFKSKQHTIVPSSSLMPDSPNLLFTNAGMNQFVPIFLGQTKCPYTPGRAADTQKCIRAGGKHNDLEDVGLDTYHHTFFEMLGNWSFGDYFKKEAIEWAWELVVGIWKFPPSRLYATVFCPYADINQWKDDLGQTVMLAKNSLAGAQTGIVGTGKSGEALEWADDESAFYWALHFLKAGLDPMVHIVPGNRKDNFWMMGETGPCGPCSELHADLTPDGNTKGSLVNKGDARCIEIWNLVFIQFNANLDGTFSPLPARHVDTGMGFERVTSIIQGTKGLTDFANAKISNYETDIFRPIFDALEKLSGKKYGSTLPQLLGSATVPVASVGVPPTESSQQGAKYYKRRLPHFERPWAKYMVSFSTRERRQLSSLARDAVLKSLLFGHDQRRYQMYAACVMPDHVHLLFEPQVKEQDKEGKPVFWPLAELMHSIKSFTAHEINKLEKTTGQVWENESFDRMIRGDADLEEKFHYICRNPWDSGVVPNTENYPWLWTPDAPGAKGNATESKGSANVCKMGSATVPVASVGVPPTASARETGTSSPVQPASHAPEAAARDAQQGDRDGRAPQSNAPDSPEQIQVDIAFRVIADHIRTLSFAIADGIQPGNNDRNYVLRRILRRAVRYGRTLGFHEPFFYKLVDVLADTMGDVFPEIRARKKQVQETIRTEEEAFNRTLDNGLELFESALKTRTFLKSKADEISEIITVLEKKLNLLPDNYSAGNERLKEIENDSERLTKITNQFDSNSPVQAATLVEVASLAISAISCGASSEEIYLKFIKQYPDFIERAKSGVAEAKLWKEKEFGGREAFVLYDTYGFPLDLTELMARERGLTVDKDGFEKLMEDQRARARAAQKKEVISLSQIETTAPTKFVGFEKLESPARVLEVVSVKDKTAVVLDTSPFYAEMGGQVGDTGEISGGGNLWRISNTQKSGNTWLHFIEAGARPSRSQLVASRDGPSVGGTPTDAGETPALPIPGYVVTLSVDRGRRNAIQRHHTVTHLLHWALHEVASKEASQKGSFVGPDKLTFDFNSAPLTPAQVADIEKLVNERILENAGVSWTEVPHADVKHRKDVMQFFGDKYGDVVRVVQIGGHATKLDGYSMELCGGTHTRATGEIGLFRIVGESAIAAGVRRIEAVAGLEAYRKANDEVHLIKTLAGRVNSPVHELDKKIEALLAHQKELEKHLKSAQQREASNAASLLLEEVKIINGIPVIIHNLGAASGDFLQAIADSLKGRFKGVIILGGVADNAVALLAAVSPEFVKNVQAGKIIQQIAPIVGGKGGGKPDNARGGGKDAAKLDEALAKAKSLLG